MVSYYNSLIDFLFSSKNSGRETKVKIDGIKNKEITIKKRLKAFLP
jgi:hypothetical protein